MIADGKTLIQDFISRITQLSPAILAFGQGGTVSFVTIDWDEERGKKE